MTPERSALRILKIYTDEPFTHTGAHLRGALLARFPDRPRLHNHHPDGRPRPAVIRYVVDQGVPCVVATGPGRAELLALYDGLDILKAPGRGYRVTGLELIERPLEIGPTHALFLYRFATPWLALNQDNHSRFGALRKEQERRALLERVLVGNFLSAADAFGVRFAPEPRVMVRLSDIRSKHIRVAGRALLGFRAELTTNLRWSRWIGVGKMTSKGFGLLDLLDEPYS